MSLRSEFRVVISVTTAAYNSYQLITNTAWIRARLCKLQKRCTWLAAASDKVYQLLAHGRWFSPGTPASSTTKTGRHDIAEILLKVALNTKIKKSKSYLRYVCLYSYNDVQHILCCVFDFFLLHLVHPMLPVSLYCSFMIDPSVFSNVYLTFRLILMIIA